MKEQELFREKVSALFLWMRAKISGSDFKCLQNLAIHGNIELSFQSQSLFIFFIHLYHLYIFIIQTIPHIQMNRYNIF